MATTKLKTYIGVKRINATPMTLGQFKSVTGVNPPTQLEDSAQGYLVEYPQGGTPNSPAFRNYVSWSPKDVFEASYFSNVFNVLKELLRLIFL